MYIDPAAGSLILQVFAAGVLAVAAGLKSVRESVRRFVMRLIGRRPAQ